MIIFLRKSNIQLLLYFRIQYCTQEIIIFREDLVNKMCRNCVRFPSSNLDIPTHVSSLLDKLPFVLYLFINLYIWVFYLHVVYWAVVVPDACGEGTGSLETVVTEGWEPTCGAGNWTPVLCRSHGAPHHRVSTPALGLVLKDLLFSFVIYVWYLFKHIFACMCQCPWKPGEGTGSLGAEL